MTTTDSTSGRDDSPHKTTTVPPWFYTQSAVIPYRKGSDGLEVLLITSMKRRRWIIPKGVVEPKLTPEESALREAYEEAGIRGRITGGPLGSYQHRKWGGVCTVTVFPMLVTGECADWPEKKQRERKWMRVEEACEVIDKEDVRRLLKSLTATMESDWS